jgi:hypothetical protein
MEDDERRKIVFWSGPEKEEKLEAIRVKPIGSGTFGRCELIRDSHTGKYFCLKTCKLTQVRWGFHFDFGRLSSGSRCGCSENSFSISSAASFNEHLE